MPIDEAILVQYLRRSYHAVDGLWFMKVEAATDFDRALEIDQQVWEVLAKIQAREARRLLHMAGNTGAELSRCLKLKFGADGHDFEIADLADGVQVTIRDCRWAELLKKSHRSELAPRLAQAICVTEGRVWCQEFGGGYKFEMPDMACCGAKQCVMRFLKK